MEDHLHSVRASVEALSSVWADALPGVLVPAADTDAALSAMIDGGLVLVVDALAAVARSVGSMQARAAAEVARRSAKELGQEGLAARHGFASPAALLAQTGGTSTGEAAKLVSVGEATRPRETFTGQQLPSRHPHVAAALRAGSLSVAAAASITGMLDRVAGRADPVAADIAEATLAENATGLSLEMVARLVKRAEAYLDPDGVEPREDELRAQRSLSMTEEPSGMTVMRGRFDPLTAAAIKAAIDALVATELRRARDAFGASAACTCPGGTAPEECPCGDQATAEQRTIPQMRADALADLARHAVGCDELAIAATHSVVVRMELEDLRDPDSVGVATIDGIDQPISAASARCVAASANIIPLVLGGDSAPLDLGLSTRLFTKLQKLALADRDGGCAYPGCTRPPGFTEAHHIRWWLRDRGPTDIANGVLLCSHHHHLVHHGEWIIDVVDGQVWFIPPPHVDPRQRPRPGNSLRRTLHAVQNAIDAGRVGVGVRLAA